MQNHEEDKVPCRPYVSVTLLSSEDALRYLQFCMVCLFLGESLGILYSDSVHTTHEKASLLT